MSWVLFSNPFDEPLHFLGLEIVIVACFTISLSHAVREHLLGARHSLFQWLVAFSYGIAMELIALNFLDNYQHGRFTVMLHHGKLPLYVVLLYPVFLYTGLKVIERWRSSWLPEALLVGFAICLIDVPFDVAGPDAHWWRWSALDKNLAVRWLGVPVTSYYWYLLFGAAYCALCRGAKGWLGRRSTIVCFSMAPLFGVAVIVVGTLLFLPFHALKALGVPDGTVVGSHLALCALLAIYLRPSQPLQQRTTLLFVPIAMGLYHSALILRWAINGTIGQGTAKLSMSVVAVAASALLAFPIARRRSAAEAASPSIAASS